MPEGWRGGGMYCTNDRLRHLPGRAADPTNRLRGPVPRVAGAGCRPAPLERLYGYFSASFQSPGDTFTGTTLSG